jgi:2-iminobutanoate/2-iminopropanoate deaminase
MPQSLRKVIHTPEAPEPIGAYSQAIQVGDTLYVSGQIGLNPETGELENQELRVETHQMMTNAKAILKAAGMELDQVVKCTLYLSDMNLFPAVNQIYGEYFEGDQPPAREAIAIRELPKQANVEISLIAVA